MQLCSHHPTPQGSEMLTALLRKVKGHLADAQQEGAGQEMLSQGCRKPDATV